MFSEIESQPLDNDDAVRVRPNCFFYVARVIVLLALALIVGGVAASTFSAGFAEPALWAFVGTFAVLVWLLVRTFWVGLVLRSETITIVRDFRSVTLSIADLDAVFVQTYVQVLPRYRIAFRRMDGSSVSVYFLESQIKMSRSIATKFAFIEAWIARSEE